MTASYLEILVAFSLLVLPFLYESNHAFKYYLKFFLYYIIVMVNSVILIPVFCLKPNNVKNLLIASDFCRFISPLIGLKWILRGKENLEKEQACILIANHQSSLDVLGMFDIWRYMDKCTVIAKKELLYSGPFGLASYLCGLIFIPRVQSDKAKTIMNLAVDKIKPDKIKLWVFPEGTRRNDGTIHPFKKGAFHMALSSQLPIVPVVYSRYYFLDKKAKRFDQGKVIITALQPIETKNMKMENLEEFMEEVRTKMLGTYHETSKEVLATLNPNSGHKIA